MPSYIALLRAVNLPGHKPVAMADLRAMLTKIGLENARTLLQSGNAVFETTKQTPAKLEQFLEAETAKRLKTETDFFVRTAAEWHAIIAANPFPGEAESDPGHLIMMCLRDAPSPKAVAVLQAAIKGRERVKAVGRQAYFVYPDGVGRSKLTMPIIERHLGTRGTGRNWNTVLKLAASANV